ncbi:MAG: hypothetical protein JTT13_11110 [Candidatus Brockarchaeota archaeon]|nr:hypothetical protein [Candidatus Brockarchaeota archaeon]
MENWLSYEDKNLNKLVEVVKSQIDNNRKVYIFSQHISTAELITDHLVQKLSLKSRDITLITGQDDAEEQYSKLDSFKRVGKILVTTPVFDKGTDIPQANTIIVYTPPQY